MTGLGSSGGDMLHDAPHIAPWETYIWAKDSPRIPEGTPPLTSLGNYHISFGMRANRTSNPVLCA